MNSFGYLPASVNRQTQRGLSLIELMISITIGLLMLSAMATLFVNQSKTRSELDKSNRMIDNGRYALELLTENLRLAGFYGEYSPTASVAVGMPTPYDAAAGWVPPTTVPVALRGYEGATSDPTGSPGLDNYKPDTDVLVVARASTSTGSMPNATNYLKVNRCAQTYATNPFEFGTATSGYASQLMDCSTAAPIRGYLLRAYYIRSCNNCANNDNIPTLTMIENGDATNPVPLVEGIEFMQVEYGIDGFDTDADGMPDRFNAGDVDGVADVYSSCAACTNAQWANVVSAKLNIIARNIEKTIGHEDKKIYSLGGDGTANNPTVTEGPLDDEYKRHAYTQVVRLVNPSGRRETP